MFRVLLAILFCVSARAGGLNLYSLEKEIALGRQLAEEVERQARLLDDPLVGEYVNRIGQNLARQANAPVTFSFKVIQSNELNAFALPGGFIFVNTGLIKMCDDEAELAAALSHEVAHVAARHMTRQASRRELTRLGTIPIDILLGGRTRTLAKAVSSTAIPLSLLTFGRHDESEADTLGLQYLDGAGYDPAASITLFEKMESLERTKPGAVARVLLTHPPHGARLREVQRQIEETLPARSQYVVSTSAYTTLRARLFATAVDAHETH